MADIAQLVLAVDSTQVKSGTAALDGLTAAGTRAQAAATGFGGGAKGAGVAAAAMAVQAQAASRAAMGMATGFKASSDAARINTLAMRETLVVAREISRGNFTRLPGSLTLLAQGVGSQGGIGAYASALANTLGLIKTVQNAELAEQATQAAASAAAVEGAAQRAASNVMAADTELALAAAQERLAVTSNEAAAASVRVAAAHEAVAVAAGEAAIAEEALAAAYAADGAAAARSAAATRTVIGGSGVGLIGIAVVAGIAYGAIKQFQDQVRDSGELDAYADKLDLTDAQIKKLGGSVTYLGHNIKEVHGLTVTFGDVMYGVWHEIAREISDNAPWNNLGKNAESVFNFLLSAWNKVSAGISAGLRTMGDALVEFAKHPMSGLPEGYSVSGDFQKKYAEELKLNSVAFANIKAFALAHREKTLQDLSDGNNPAAPKKPKKVSDHGLQDALDKLDAGIKGQYALAAAYGVSAAAAQRAEASQKAAEDAISHKGSADLFYAKELQKAVATDVARQAKTNAGLNLELSIRSELNGQLADGSINVAQYNDQLKLQTTLNALNADLENADIAHKQVVRDLIKQTIDLNTEQLQIQAQFNALSQEAANDNDIDRMRLENSLMGVSNKERATAIAQLEAIQQLKQIDPNGLLTNGERDTFIQSAVSKAVAGVQSPFQQWAKDIPQTSAAITEALQGIEVHGFDALAQGIAGVISGTESLGQVFKNISQQIIGDLVQMIIKMLIFRAISAAFGGGLGGGATDGGVSLTDLYGGPIGSAKGNVFSGGNIIPFALGGVVSSPTMFPMNGGRTGIMGEAGTEAVMPLTRDGQGRLGVRAANSNGPSVVEIHVVRGEMFEPIVQQISGEVAVRVVEVAAPQIAKGVAAGINRSATRPKLMGTH